ncbi:MAG: Mycofactocin system glycosyltransferase, partial [Frankiales bacterium]|nr:Mycofactocin system glycosyltransferase [Frankiales bacterium]
ALVLAPLLVEWRSRRTGAGPLTFVGNGLLDQAAYGAGVVHGCVQHRTLRPLMPRTTTAR